MKTSKKILVLTILTSMILAAFPPVRAQFISNLVLEPEQGDVGTLVDITGRTEPNTVVQLCYSRTDNARPTAPTAPCSFENLLTNLISGSTDITSGSNGVWEATVRIPASVAGRHPLVAIVRDAPEVQAPRFFTVIPNISHTSTGAVDDAIQVTGTGYAGNSPIIINYDSPAMSCVALPFPELRRPVTTDQFGSFQGQCTVPESDFTVPDGRHEIEAVDRDRNVDPDLNQFFLIPSVTISPDRGPVGVSVNTDVGTTLTPPDPGVTVTVRARGFVKLKPITVCFERSRTFEDCRTGTATGLGSLPPFEFPMPQIPQKPAGARYIFDANQTTSGITLGPASMAPDVTVRPGEFAVVSDLDLRLDHAFAGEEVEAIGTGFAAGSPFNSLEVTLRRLPTIAPGSRPCTGDVVVTLVTGRTLSSGSFFLTFSTPGERTAPTGLYQVLAKDSASPANEACADFVIGSFFRVKPNTPAEGKVGDIVTVQGFGFTREEGTIVNVKMTSTQTTTPATRSCGEIETEFQTNANGDFEGTFPVPNCNRDNFRITATDENRKTASFEPYRVFPWVEISPAMGVKDSTLTVTLTGFARNAAVEVTYFGVDSRATPGETLAPRVPLGFALGSSLQIWNGAIPEDLSGFTGARLGVGDLVDLWEIESVGRLEVVTLLTGARSVTVGSLGNGVASFAVPESWGGYHPVSAREVSGEPCGPDGFGPVITSPVLCGQPFRVLPTVSVSPSDPKAGEERMTLEGSGYAWWEHYTRTSLSPAGRIVVAETTAVYRLAFDIGRIERYIDEARHIMNGVRDPSWDFGAYLPIALNQQGTIVYWDYRLEDKTGIVPAGGSLGQKGSPFLRAPGLQPGGYDVVAYRLILGSVPSADRSESAMTGITLKSAEKDAIDGARTDLQNARNDILGRVGQAQDALLAGIDQARAAIADVVTQAQAAIALRIGDAQTAIVDRVGVAQTAIVDRVGVAQTAISDRVGEAQTAIVTRVGDAQTAIVNRVGVAQTAMENRVDEAQDALTTEVNDAQTAVVNRIGDAQTSLSTQVSQTQNAVVTRVADAQTALQNSVGTRASQSSVDTKASQETANQINDKVSLTLQTTPLGYVIAILAAIAALGSIAAAIVTSRRLKVAG